MDDTEPDKWVPKWEIEPHPYDHQYDVLWVDTDEEAHAAILYAAEMHLWDSCAPGEERTLTVRHLRGVAGGERERIYMATIQHGHGDKFHEWESHIQAPDIFRAAEIFKVDCEPNGWWIVAIEEVDFVD